MDWIEISVQADGEAAEAVSELFNRLNSRPDGQGGAVTEVSGFDPVGEAHHPSVTVRTYLPADEPDTGQRQQALEEGLWFLSRLYPLAEPKVRRLAEEDWANAWKAYYNPIPIGERLVIVPAWQANAEPYVGRTRILLDPGMAFGTGLHPSTQLCLGFLEKTLMPGSSVLDAGCGSGILSIAAAKLGSGPISAFDVDPLATKATTENAALNGVDGQIEAWTSSGPGDGSQWGSTDSAPRSWQLLLVNILLPVILELLDRGLARHLAPGGRMVLGGLIADQRPQLVEALHRHGLRLEQERIQGDWLGAVAIFDDNSPS